MRQMAKRSVSRKDDRLMRQKAHAFIQRLITSGELRAGSPVSELAVAKQLGISRTPIREAIAQLVAEGLLEQIPNRGVVVGQLTRRDIVDLYELREALEVYAAGKAACQPVSRADLDRLQELADSVLSFKQELEKSGEPALNPEQMHRLAASDLGFHTLLVRAAANPRILKIVTETRLLIRVFAMHRDGHNIPALEQIHRYHCDVLRAVVDRDREGAMRILSEHIMTSLKERLVEFDHWEREESLRQSVPLFMDMFSNGDAV